MNKLIIILLTGKFVIDNSLNNLCVRVYDEKRRLVAPLIGFPGVRMTGTSIKLAQQNYSEHFKVLKILFETFQPDVIFPLMDLSVEANALGWYTLFPQEESATVKKNEFSVSDIERLERIDISCDSRLLNYIETVRLMKIGLPPSVQKGAYVTGPYTLAALLMGAEEAALATIINPEELNAICEFTTKTIVKYTELLISAGAEVICVLEPNAVMLDPGHFEKFSAGYVQRISEYCRNHGIPTIYHICGNTMHLLGKMSKSGVDAFSLDSREAGVDLVEAAKTVAGEIVMIGNISPTGKLLDGKPDDVKEETLQLMKSMDEYPNFILSTGCDLPQEIPLENIRAFIETGKNYRISLR